MNTVTKGGVVGGIIGGVVFGMMMQMMGKIPMIAMMVGSESMAVGWIIHMIISIFTGVIFAFIFGEKIKSTLDGVKFGTIYGFIWWILGPLFLMPLILGMGAQFASAFSLENMLGLMGHIIFGIIIGITVARYKN